MGRTGDAVEVINETYCALLEEYRRLICERRMREDKISRIVCRIIALEDFICEHYKKSIKVVHTDYCFNIKRLEFVWKKNSKHTAFIDLVNERLLKLRKSMQKSSPSHYEQRRSDYDTYKILVRSIFGLTYKDHSFL